MAVSFKVPKSPTRSIFNIDNFLGVDLTNTGSNIDEVRSPNAENMVRYVPGKVRKRTGYHTKVKFSSIKDINRAVNTTDSFVEHAVTGTDYFTRDILFDMYTEIDSPLFYGEFIGKGTYVVGFNYSAGGGTNMATITLNEENFTWVYWWSWTTPKVCDFVYIYRTSNNDDDYLKVRNVRVCASTSAESSTEWRELPWSAAPEDSGVIYVEDESNPTIYGCHSLKSGTFTGNRVKNVNRVINSSDEFTTFTCDDSVWTSIYTLYDFVYESALNVQTTPLYIDFDYISDGEVMFLAAGWYSSQYTLVDTGGEVYHYHKQEKCGSYVDRRLAIKAVSGSATVQIKNLTVCYEKDSHYEYKPAPEDDGGTFHIEDIYNVGSKNYAIKDSDKSPEMSSTNLELEFGATVCDSTKGEVLEGFSKVSFDLYTTSDQDIEYIKVETGNDQYYYSGIQKYFYDDVKSEHVEFYVSAGNPPRYTKMVYVKVKFRTTEGKSTIRLSNIKVNSISLRNSYDISTKYYIYHAGSKLYLRASNSTDVTPIYNYANHHISKSWQLNDKLFILDAEHIYSYSIGDSSVEVLGEEGGYIPLVTISKSPSGGGTSYEALNMLQPAFEEQFLVSSDDANEKNFYLSFNGLDDTPVKAWVLSSVGNWDEKVEGTHFSVDRAAGLIKFTNAPGVTPVAGEDNVKIRAYRTVGGYADRISKCTNGTLFGVGGAADRLFVTGNPDYPNWDFYSEQYDPTYFPDTGYSALGSKASAIVGYAIINNYLATFKDDYDSSQAVFIREGNLVVKQVQVGDRTVEVSEPAFRLINTLQGNGVVAPYSFGYLQTEPVFLTRAGVYAITAQDITGEKYSQNRSFYLDGKLTKEENLENAVATVFNDMYVLALNNQFYILDGLQATRTDRAEPYATRQYVGFYCTNIPAVSLWTDDQALWIGTNDGRVCRFATDIDALDSYNDDGNAIYACWETPDLDGKLFYKNKTFRYFAIRMMKALRTTAALYSMKRGNWTLIKEDRLSGIVFDFYNIDFANFSFSTDRSEKVVHTKVRVKKVDKARFKVENTYVNEPFGLFDLALEYIESGNYKG